MRLSLIRNHLLTSLGASIVFAASGAFAEEYETKEAWRLFVADHEKPVVRVIDFEDGKELGRYDVKGYPGRLLLAVSKASPHQTSRADARRPSKSPCGP